MSVSKSLDYATKEVSHGTYQFSKVTPNNGSQSVSLTTSGGQESTFEMPGSKVFNPGKSILSFIATPAASGASNFNYVHTDGLPFIRNIQFYTRNGVYLTDINDVNKYCKMTMRRSHPISEVESFDKVGNATGVFEGLYTSNALITAVEAKRPTNNVAKTNYLEPAYCVVGTDNTADPIITVQIPFSRIVDSVIGLDKDLYFSESVYIRIVWAPSTQIAWYGTSATVPHTGAATYAGAIALTNVTVFTAIEQNPVITQSIMDKFNSSSFSFLVPYIYSNKQSLTSASQNISLKYNAAHGRKLKRVLHSLFESTETGYLALENNNLADNKVLSYYNMVNNTRISQFNYDTSSSDDWLALKHLTKGMSLLSSNEFYYNYVMATDFIEGSHDPNLDDGLSLETEVKWDFIGTTANATHMHYVYAVTTKMLTISPNGVTLQ